MSQEHLEMYERIWDEADYVIPPSENNAFFIKTNGQQNNLSLKFIFTIKSKSIFKNFVTK